MIEKNKIVKARAGLIWDSPFFGSLALRLELIEDKSCETAWTDGQFMGYNPTFISSLSLEKVKALLAHEVMHVACSHHTRRQNRKPKKWNIAGDYAINDLLEHSGFSLPNGALKGFGLDNSAESIYAKIPDPPEDGGADPGKCGEVRDAQGKKAQIASPAELAQVEADVKVTIAQAAQQAKAMGRMPSNLKRLIDEILSPKQDWKEILRRFVSQCAKNDYTWTPPNRRYVHMGLYFPSMRSEELSRITVAIDTSGSVSQKDLSDIACELSGIIEAYNSRVDVLYVDAKVSGTESFDNNSLPLKLNPKGGGGTNFRPAFDYIDKSNDFPDCMIYLTDGYCSSFPKKHPEYPVLWGIIGRNERFCPPFGDVLEL